MAIQKPASRVVAALVAAVLVFASLIAVGAPAQAVTNQGTTEGRTTTFYAFVKKGERMRVVAGSFLEDTSVRNENGVEVALSGGYSPTAAGDGVWRVKLTHTSNDDHRGYSYDLSVRSGTTEKKGRIWVNTDAFEQAKYSDLTYYGVSNLGYVYKIKLDNALGWYTKLALRSTGPAPDENCEVESRSFDVTNDSDASLAAYLDCGDKYRLFFEDPRSAGLPATAKMGNSTVQVLPTLVTTSQLTSSTKVVFTPNTDKVGGSFTVVSHSGFSGTAELQIDANSNGSYTDTVDLKRTVVVNGGTSQPWVWNGKNASGTAVTTGAKARAVISRSGEAHLVLQDFEAMGGLTMTRLNGDAPDSKIFWDDRQLLRKHGGTVTSGKSCLSGCDSSVSGGIHGWTQGEKVNGVSHTTSLGDGNVIDSWAYASINAVSPVVTLPALSTLTFDGTGGSIVGVTSIKRTNGLAWGTLPTASVAGKVFLGWYTAKSGGTQVTSATLASGTITAYAQWRPARFNVVFYGNAQTGAVTGATASTTVDAGCTTCKLPTNGFTKTTGAPELIDHDEETTEVNSTFLGWSLDPASHTGDIANQAVAGNLSNTDGATVKLYAIWDDAPRFLITSYPDRFFTLKKAKAGEITEAELLRTVKASDLETNPLAPKTSTQVQSSGSDVGVTLFDYDASDFTSLTASGVVTVTYKVKDGAGNVAFLRIRVTVSDDAPQAQDAPAYLRGISSEFAGKGAGEGGLPADSLWKTDPTRQAALTRALSGSSATTYCLDAEAMVALRTQVGAGLGNSTAADGLAATAALLREDGSCG